MKGSALAVTIISPQEFDRQRLERDAKREALQQQQEQQQQKHEPQQEEMSATPSASGGVGSEGEHVDQPTYEAVDDVRLPLDGVLANH
jgi:transcription initiation factor TFIID subunit TAF12